MGAVLSPDLSRRQRPLTEVPRRCDSLERQKQYVGTLRAQLKDPTTFKRIYNFAFDYAKAQGQKSLRASRRRVLSLGSAASDDLGRPPERTEFDIARELWSLLVPLDPGSGFPPEHLALWLRFLEDKGSRAVSRDTWSLVRAQDSSLKQLAG